MRSFLCLLVFCLASCSSNPSGLADASDEGFFTSGDIQLHYVLDFPDDGPGPYPTIVLGHGSGPKTIRDLEAFAKRMLNLGFAVLRYDKRGTGDSGGRFVPSNTTEVNTAIPKYYAPDMAAAVRFVAGHQKVDRERIGLLGESQAGWVIPPAAVEAGNAAFVIILSGPVTPLGNVGAYERYANEHPDVPSDTVMARLERDGVLRGLGFDPGPSLSQLDMPGLWIYGAWDRNVPAPASVRILEALRSNADKAFTTILYPNGDHGLRDKDTREGIPWWEDVGVWLKETGF